MEFILPHESSIKKLDLSNVKKASLVLRAINHKVRQQMLTLINERSRITVTEIYVTLKLGQPDTSQHLAILRKAGFVNNERVGKFIYYFINSERLEKLNVFIENVLR